MAVRDTPARRVAAALAALLVALAAVGAPVAAPTAMAETRVFDLSIGGLRAGELTLSVERNGTAYSTGSRIRSTGLLGALARFRYDGTSAGHVAGDGSIVPVRHSARARDARNDRVTELVFENGDPARVVVDPPRRSPVDPADHPGTVDPVSAAFAILLETRPDAVCNSRLELFDGHRRSQVLVGRAERRDGGLVCNGQYARLSGDRLPTTDDDAWGFRLFYRPETPDRVVLERIEAPTRFGLAVVTPRR